MATVSISLRKLIKGMTVMNRQATKMKENRFTQLLLLGILGFGIVITILSSLSIQPNLTNGYFYLLLFVVLAVLYKPFGLFLLNILVSIIKSIIYLFNKFTIRKARNIETIKIDQLNCLEIVHYLETLFQKQGYETELSEDSNEIASDLIINKGARKYIVQTKLKDNNVDVKAIREVIWEVRNYEANGAIIITNQYFTSSAKKLAKSKDIRLI